MERYLKSKILAILLICFGLGVPTMPWFQVEDIGDAMIALFLTISVLWIIPIISGIYAFLATSYKFVVFGTSVSLVYCVPLVLKAIKYSESFSLYWILLAISLIALVFVVLSRDDFR